MELDHVVIWVDDPLKSLDFYVNVVGLTPVRGEEFRVGMRRSRVLGSTPIRSSISRPVEMRPMSTP